MPKTINLSQFKNVPNDLCRIVQIATKNKIDFVQRNIFLADTEFILIDVKLSPWPDEDVVYRDDEIRLLIPRGLCFVFVNDTWIYTLYGHPKFGNFGDYILKTHQIENINQCKKIFTSKENGECAHWGAFVFNNQIYEIYGSKNVHMIVRSSEWKKDLELYTDLRYTYALKMAILINTYDKTLALDFLMRTGYTLCGEGCFTDSQHFVNYSNSTMFFFAVTGKRENINDSLVKVTPTELTNLIKSFNLIPVNEVIVCENIGQQKEIENYFEHKNNSEGAVVTCVNELNEIIYTYKHKNIRYIYERALREQMKKNAHNLKIIERFRTIHIFHPNHEKLLEKFLNFNSWFVSMNLSEKDKELFFSNWVRMMEKFESFSSDEQQSFQNINNLNNTNTLTVIMTIGLPGSGKSFLARCSDHIINSNNKKCCHLEQDMFGANKPYQKAISEKLKDMNLQYLILAKANHNILVRKSTYDTLFKSNRNIKIIYVVMGNCYENDDVLSTVNLCVNRINSRGLSHKTLFGKSDNEINTIISNIFVKDWQGLTKEELAHNNVINVDINKNKMEMIKMFCQNMQTLLDDVDKNDINVSDNDLLKIFDLLENQDIETANKNKLNKANKKK